VSTIEIVAASILLISVVLSARENIWSWPTAIVGVALYIFICYEARLYADMGLQCIYVLINIYGWWKWLHGGKNNGELHVSRAPLRIVLIGSIVAIATTVAFGLFFHHYTKASFPFVDSALSSFSLLAQYLMARKYIENWYIWIAVDVFYVPMYTSKHLYATAVLYALFIAPCVLGVVEWRKTIGSEPLATERV